MSFFKIKNYSNFGKNLKRNGAVPCEVLFDHVFLAQRWVDENSKGKG